MLQIEFTKKFKKDMKTMKKRGADMKLIDDVIRTLMEEKPLAPKYKDHVLSGEYSGLHECHILPDWLLIYDISHERLTLIAYRTGTHSDLF